MCILCKSPAKAVADTTLNTDFRKDVQLWEQFKRHVKAWHQNESVNGATDYDLFNRWTRMGNDNAVHEDSSFCFDGEYHWLKNATELAHAMRGQHIQNMNFADAWSQLYSEAVFD